MVNEDYHKYSMYVVIYALMNLRPMNGNLLRPFQNKNAGYATVATMAIRSHAPVLKPRSQ